MKTLELHLSEELAASLARNTTDAESFAIEALQARLGEIEKKINWPKNTVLPVGKTNKLPRILRQ